LNSSQLQPSVADSTKAEFSASHFLYHPATLEISITQLSQIVSAIDQAINKFLQLSSVTQSIPSTASNESPETHETQQSLKERQLRLSERLKERLGYLGVYYKRNPQNFIRYMSAYQREELLQQLKADYREIILAYFSDTADLNQKLDNFVNTAFFVDISVAQIVEIHMELMDEFSKQLKLEGRSDEILLDYRLTLIDTIAHLCEMYRRSIPRET
jgi:circadian clock protein KaiA